MRIVLFTFVAFFLFAARVSLATEPEIDTDRPDVTESAHSVGEGYFQVESGLFNYARDGSAETFDYLNVNAKYGISRSADLQLLVNPYTKDRSAGSSQDSRFHGLGLRLKQNVIDGNSFALALMPFTIFPQHSSDAEYGIAAPVDLPISESLSLGGMVQGSNVNLDKGNGWQSLNTIALGYDLTSKWGAFVEVVGVYTESEDPQYYANHGATYLLDALTQLDCGVYHGLNGAADDFSFSLGLSFKR